MRVALVSTLSTPVRLHGSGSVEGLVWLLSRELTARGHDVTVFAAAGSEPVGALVATLPGTYAENGAPDDWQACEWINLCRAAEMSDRFDVVHSHAYLYGLPLHNLFRCPTVHTMHVLGTAGYARLWEAFPDARVTAISRHQWSAFPSVRPAAIIPHGVDESQFTFRAEPEDYFCFLGRFMPGKGVLEAIHAARELGVRLRLAGPTNEYFEQQVRPLVDGRSVEYVGWVAGPERDRLLGGARALLYPQQHPEPFGLVQVEAMMCGTPVAAVGIGAVPEIVEEGVTGAVADPGAAFVPAVERAMRLSRRRVRDTAIARFPASRMADGYEAVYQDAVEAAGCRTGAR
jgi:glycosyltransferase involved in cell wall biosynthesis